MVTKLKTMQNCVLSCVQNQMNNLSSTDTEELGAAIDILKDLSESIYYETITEAMNNTDKMYYDDRRIYRKDPNSDFYTGRSSTTRKMYMEHKELHKDKNLQMQELEKYLTELGHDVLEMIDDSTPDEKQLLRSKLIALSNKIV